MAEAFAQGARASVATVFVVAGGASVSIELAWAGLVLEELNGREGRARFTQAIEAALDGWILRMSSVPAGESGRSRSIARASMSLSPVDRAWDEGRVGSMASSVRGLRPVLEKLKETMDALCGGPSVRGCHSGLANVDETGGNWDCVFGGSGKAGGQELGDLASSMESSVCAEKLKGQAGGSEPMVPLEIAKAPRL